MSLPDNDDDLLITYDDEYVSGQVLRDKYELLRPIGAGGMGVVWVAHDRILDVDVAVKISRRIVDDSSKLMEQRALTEARLAAQLAHPAICRVLDFGLTGNGDPFVVSELLNGEELDLLLANEGRLAPVRAVKTLLPILDGLGAAHAKGIVHRDVKPANMFLATDGDGHVQPKLLDFGVARFVNTQLRITSPGTVCGTAFYMSPEQARGSAELDARSDLWSFCASLYELVSGSPPFEGDSYNAVLAAVLTSKPRPLVDLLAADAALSAIVMRGLARAPESRFATAQELGSALAQWLLDQGEEYDIRGHSLRERLVAPLSASRPYRARMTTPRALSTTVAAAPSPKLPLMQRALRAALATLAVGTLLGSAAYAFRPGPEARATEPEAPAPAVLAAALPIPQHGAQSTRLVTVAAPSAIEVPEVGSAPKVLARSPAKPAPAARVSPASSEAEAAAADPRKPEQRNLPVRPRKTNALGYEFGF